MELQFEDVAQTCSVRWCVREQAALKYLKATFANPQEALWWLKEYLIDRQAPMAFWSTL